MAQNLRVVQRSILSDEVPRLYEHALGKVGSDDGRVFPARGEAPREESTTAADVKENAASCGLQVALRHHELDEKECWGTCQENSAAFFEWSILFVDTNGAERFLGMNISVLLRKNKVQTDACEDVNKRSSMKLTT